MLKTLNLQSQLLVAFAFFMPWSRLLNVNTIFLVLLLLLFIRELFKRKFFLPKFDNTTSLILFFFIVLSSIFYSNDLIEGFYEVSVWLFLIIPLSLMYEKQITYNVLKAVSFYFILSVALATLFLIFHSIIEYKTNPLPIIKGFSYFTSPLKMHPSYFSIYFIFAFILFIHFTKSSKNKIVLHSFYWVVLLMIVFFIRSRASIIIALILFLVKLATLLKGIKRYIFVLILLLFIFFNWYNFLEFISFERNISTAIHMRYSLWKSSLELIKDNFFFGVGVGDLQLEFDKQNFLFGLDQAIDRRYNIHNQYLHIFTSTGLLGFSSFISIFYFIIKKQIELRSFVVFSFLIIMLISMMFDTVLNMLHGVYFFSFFATLLLKTKTNNEDN